MLLDFSCFYIIGNIKPTLYKTNKLCYNSDIQKNKEKKYMKCISWNVNRFKSSSWQRFYGIL